MNLRDWSHVISKQTMDENNYLGLIQVWTAIYEEIKYNESSYINFTKVSKYKDHEI